MRSAVELEQPVLAAVVARDPPRRGDRHLGRLRRQLAALEACRQLGDLRVRGVGELDAGVDRASHQGQRLRGNGEVSPWAFAESRPIRGDRTAMAAPVVSEGASMPGGVRLEWAQPEEPDYAHTQVTTRDPGAQDDRTWTVKGTYFERYFETLPVPPVSQQYAVRHVDRSGNASVAETVAAAPPAVVDRVGVIRDSVYLAQAPGGSPPSAPHDIDGASGWTRKPVAPTSALPVVWQAYREANLDGEVNLAWSDWSVPELYAVENDSTVPGFTTQVELEFQSLALDGSVVAESATCIEPTHEAPLVQVRQRFRASSAAFPAWDDLVHCWTAVARLTPDGAVYGVKARLDTGFACDPDQERTIYRRSASHLTPANPTGNAAVPPGWYGHERIATLVLSVRLQADGADRRLRLARLVGRRHAGAPRRVDGPVLLVDHHPRGTGPRNAGGFRSLPVDAVAAQPDHAAPVPLGGAARRLAARRLLLGRAGGRRQEDRDVHLHADELGRRAGKPKQHT